MSQKNYIILQFDILIFPPALSLIEILLDKDEEVELLGYCSKIENLQKYLAKGLRFYNLINYNDGDSSIVKLKKLQTFKNKVEKIVKNNSNNQFWFLSIESVWLFNKIIPDVKSIIYFFEVPKFSVPIQYRIWCSNKFFFRAVAAAFRVISCEVNRGLITKSFFGLTDEQNVIIPNKTNFFLDESKDQEIEGILNTFQNKKIILYQGGFNFPERRLDELCEAVEYLPENFVVAIMGPETPYKSLLIQKYQSSRVLFLPFIKAPDHLKITESAYIGFLSYFPTRGNIEQILNVLYCAPNKIYEYAKFGIPMLSNALPALQTFYEANYCGIAVADYNGKALADAILKIEANYEVMTQNALIAFNSVDVGEIMENKILI